MSLLVVWIQLIPKLLKQVILKEKERGAIIIFSDHVMTNVEELCDDILMIRDGRGLAWTCSGCPQSIWENTSFVSSEQSKEELENLPHVKQVSLTKQGSWKLILDDESAGRELLPNPHQGQYIATLDQQAPTIDEIFKPESGGSMRNMWVVTKETYLRHVKSWSFFFMVISPSLFRL